MVFLKPYVIPTTNSLPHILNRGTHFGRSHEGHGCHQSGRPISDSSFGSYWMRSSLCRGHPPDLFFTQRLRANVPAPCSKPVRHFGLVCSCEVPRTRHYLARVDSAIYFGILDSIGSRFFHRVFPRNVVHECALGVPLCQAVGSLGIHLCVPRRGWFVSRPWQSPYRLRTRERSAFDLVGIDGSLDILTSR